MTVMIDLSPTEEALLTDAARQKGLDPAALVKALVAEHLPAPPQAPKDPMLALFAQWAQEDTQMTPEEVAEENRTREEFKTNINAARDCAGARRAF